MDRVFEDTREPLLPSRRSSLNTRAVAGHEHKRRKVSLPTDDTVLCTWKFDAITLLPTPTQKSFTFLPISTILRAHLSLSWLATSISHSPQPGSVLRAEITGIARWEYHVLVARLASCQTLFAFEKIANNTYLCYPLQSWVKPQWIEQAALGAAPIVDMEILLRPQGEHGHSRKPSSSSAVGAINPSPIVSSPKIAQNRKGQLARMSILDPREKTEEPLSTVVGEVEGSSQALGILSFDNKKQYDAFNMVLQRTGDGDLSLLHTDSEPLTKELDTPVVHAPLPFAGSNEPVKAVDHLSTEHLRRQYLETLYVSKTSLAFYAKGPLSRARARVRAPNASRSPQGLIDVYAESVIASKKLDNKYKASIQSKIAEFRSSEDDSLAETKPNPWKSKRTKLGKDGLWPLEHEYIEKWWKNQKLACQPVLATTDSSTEVRQLILQLRMRETEMQILLILEILALEARDVPAQHVTELSSNPEVKIESVEGNEANALPKIPQARKSRDLKAELDLLVDRLCIWHSVGLEDTDASLIKLQASGSSSDRPKDRLRDFCKDVVVPFYSGKVPNECHAICTKMGGLELSPRRPKKGPEKDSISSAPGTAIAQERFARKRNLERILSEDRCVRHVSPPSLSRSATLPIAANAKREPSERPISRSGLQKSVSFSNREVDLIADARATATKRRKFELVAAQKRELDAAIETLKRPNRSVVAKSFMDDADRRNAEPKVARKVEPVQITATPQKNRIRRIDSSDCYDLPTMAAVTARRDESLVPSSTAKPRGLGHLLSSIPKSSAKKQAVLSAIHDTPSRVMTDSSDLFRANRSFHDSDGGTNGVSSSTLVASTPATSRLRVDLFSDSITSTPMRMSKSLRPVLLTPLKRSDVNMESVFKDAPEIPEHAGKMMDRVMGSKVDSAGVSLYESLGWDDDYDL